MPEFARVTDYTEVPAHEVADYRRELAERVLQLVREELRLPDLKLTWVRVWDRCPQAFMYPCWPEDGIYVSATLLADELACCIAHEGWHVHQARRGSARTGWIAEWGAEGYAWSFCYRHGLPWPKEPGP